MHSTNLGWMESETHFDYPNSRIPYGVDMGIGIDIDLHNMKLWKFKDIEWAQLHTFLSLWYLFLQSENMNSKKKKKTEYSLRNSQSNAYEF